MPEQKNIRPNSKLEQKLDELAYLIESGKPTVLSRSNVVINRDVAFELLEDMRQVLPEELVKYHEMTNRYGNIIGEAQERASTIEKEARNKQAKLINEHEIVREAYDKANSMVNEARKESDEILIAANREADLIREGAFEYTQNAMVTLQKLLSEAYRLMDNAYRPFMEGVENHLKEVNMALQGLEEPVPDDYEQEAPSEEYEKEEEEPDALEDYEDGYEEYEDDN